MVMVTYSLNWMGPINKEWISKYGGHWSTGRIDIRDDSKEGYCGWNEYGLHPMHTEDWNALGDYLWDLETPKELCKIELIESFEKWYGKKIRWYYNT